MYTYRNKNTGVEFSSICACHGEDWEEIVSTVRKKKISEKEKVAPVQPEEERDDE